MTWNYKFPLRGVYLFLFDSSARCGWWSGDFGFADTSCGRFSPALILFVVGVVLPSPPPPSSPPLGRSPLTTRHTIRIITFIIVYVNWPATVFSHVAVEAQPPDWFNADRAMITEDEECGGGGGKRSIKRREGKSTQLLMIALSAIINDDFNCIPSVCIVVPY